MGMTFTSLSAQILSELNRTDADTTAQVPNFINQAIQQICADSKNVGFEVYVHGNFTIGNPIYPKPGRWRTPITMNYGTTVAGVINVNVMELRTYEYIRDYWPAQANTSPPLYYADYGYSNFIIAPTPDLAYPFEYSYLEAPAPLSSANQTNWLTDNAPNLIFYGSLVQAVLFLKDYESVDTYKKYYQENLDAINRQDDKRFTDRGSVREAD